MLLRNLDHSIQKSKKSALILGPRQTGKSTLALGMKPDIKINLARESEFLAFASNPDELERRLNHVKPRLVLIDEVQRLTSLLNTVQAILDERKLQTRFLLTGSSARKLRRGSANLLPGRVILYEMTPLVLSELHYECDVDRILKFGTLPGIFTDENDDDCADVLKTYSATYLKEEIQAEALTQNIEGFARFLKIVASCATQFLDLSKLASEAQIPRQTAVRFFEILEDTLIVERCPPFAKDERKRLVQHPRFFFFDIGVLNGILGNFSADGSRIGSLFEHLIFNQLSHSLKSLRKEGRISTFRTSGGAEVDFILELENKTFAIEVKASKQVSRSDLSGIRAFTDYAKKHKVTPFVFYLGSAAKVIEGVPVLPWCDGISELGL